MGKDSLTYTTVQFCPPEVAAERRLTASVTSAVAEGDAGAEDRARAAGELWDLRAAHSAKPPLGEERVLMIFDQMSVQLAAIADAEADAIGQLGKLLTNR